VLNSEPPAIPIPALVLGLWAIAETCAGLLRRRGSGVLRETARCAVWAARPWAVWAAVNAVFRWKAELGFNHRGTFPFFAAPWIEGLPIRRGLRILVSEPGFWMWEAIAFALAGLIVLYAVRVGAMGAAERSARRMTLPGLTLFFFLAAAFHLAVGCTPRGIGMGAGARVGSLLSAWHAHATLLYAVPVIRSPEHFLENFIELQPALRHTIHGLSHPPGGALSMYALGHIMGVDGMDIRSDWVRLSYSLALTLFGAINIYILYGLGRRLFHSRPVGLATALLWMTAPLVVLYATFSQNGLYAVFFNASLLLGWETATQHRVPRGAAVLLGVVFFALTALNYSWCIATTIFAAFAVQMAVRRHWARRDIVWRLGVPLGVMGLLLAAALFHYQLDYIRMFLFARNYVGYWYRFDSLYQHAMALLGGQIDLFVLMGAVTCSAFCAALSRFRPDSAAARSTAAVHAHAGGGGGSDPGLQPRVVYLLTILGVYAIPILFGPNSLKMEAARCWNWIASVPMAFAAAELCRQPRRRLFLGGAAAVSALTAIGMRLFLNFAP
jgi:hypothetical protein